MVDPDLLLFSSAKAKAGNSGSRSVIFSDSRGRYVKPIIPRGKVKRIAVDATLRAAAPYQKSRRLRNPNKSIIIEENDFCLLYTSPSPRDKRQSRMPSSA